MDEVFRDILDMDDIEGVVLVSFEGEILFQKFPGQPDVSPEDVDIWPALMDALRDIREADFVYEDKRFYVRRTKLGYLFILLGHFAPVAKLRLNCDVLLPSLERKQGGKAKRRFFQRKK
jgi:hypothetical protein